MRTCIVIVSDGKLLVIGEASGQVSILDVQSRAIMRRLDAHKEYVDGVDVQCVS